MKLKHILTPALAAGAIALAGCRGTATPEERQARHNLAVVGGHWDSPANLPALKADSRLTNFLAFAVLNSPQVQAAYFEWAGAVENITVARSLPDPQLTFQADIGSVVSSLMPGFIQNFPTSGKLRARARLAAAGSDKKYFAFESAALQAAFDFKKSYFALGLLEEQIYAARDSLALLETAGRAAQADYRSGRETMAGLLRVQGEVDRQRNALAVLEDSRRPLLAAFKAALGLAAARPDPPVPGHFEYSVENPDAAVLLRDVLSRNPQLKAMEAEVRAAEAGIAVAYKERLPDFSLGLMADLKASPVLFRPLAGITLPIWRDRLAAQVAQSKAGELAAQSRLKAAQIALGVSVAEKVFAVRETDRGLALLQNEILPKARRSVESIRSGYRVGMVPFSELVAAERGLLELKLEKARSQTARELALAELSLLAAGILPANLPVLPETDQR